MLYLIDGESVGAARRVQDAIRRPESPLTYLPHPHPVHTQTYRLAHPNVVPGLPLLVHLDVPVGNIAQHFLGNHVVHFLQLDVKGCGQLRVGDVHLSRLQGRQPGGFVHHHQNFDSVQVGQVRVGPVGRIARKRVAGAGLKVFRYKRAAADQLLVVPDQGLGKSFGGRLVKYGEVRQRHCRQKSLRLVIGVHHNLVSANLNIVNVVVVGADRLRPANDQAFGRVLHPVEVELYVIHSDGVAVMPFGAGVQIEGPVRSAVVVQGYVPALGQVRSDHSGTAQLFGYQEVKRRLGYPELAGTGSPGGVEIHTGGVQVQLYLQGAAILIPAGLFRRGRLGRWFRHGGGLLDRGRGRSLAGRFFRSSASHCRTNHSQ